MLFLSISKPERAPFRIILFDGLILPSWRMMWSDALWLFIGSSLRDS